MTTAQHADKTTATSQPGKKAPAQPRRPQRGPGGLFAKGNQISRGYGRKNHQTKTLNIPKRSIGNFYVEFGIASAPICRFTMTRRSLN